MQLNNLRKSTTYVNNAQFLACHKNVLQYKITIVTRLYDICQILYATYIYNLRKLLRRMSNLKKKMFSYSYILLEI